MLWSGVSACIVPNRRLDNDYYNWVLFGKQFYLLSYSESACSTLFMRTGQWTVITLLYVYCTYTTIGWVKVATVHEVPYTHLLIVHNNNDTSYIHPFSATTINMACSSCTPWYIILLYIHNNWLSKSGHNTWSTYIPYTPLLDDLRIMVICASAFALHDALWKQIYLIALYTFVVQIGSAFSIV